MDSPAQEQPLHKPRFCEGSILRHVLVMSGTGAIGLLAVFIVDFLNLFYISLLGNASFTAAIGFTGVIGFLQLSVCIGMSIGIVVVIARLIGSQNFAVARRIATSFMIFMTVIMLIIGIGTALFATPILRLLGAQPDVIQSARIFIVIVSPALFLVALGMGLSSLLRAVGDAKRSMHVTLIGALVTAIVDPILILGFHLGIEGAAISTVLSRIAVSLLGFYSLRIYNLLVKPEWKWIIADTRYVLTIAFPAILTNLATPVGSAFTVRIMSHFGNHAIAAQATIDRITPVVFAFVFALTGSVGPIISQNFGAGLRERMQETLSASLKLALCCVISAWIIFTLGQNFIIDIFSLKEEGADLMHLFCNWVILSNLFIGMLFVSNTAFNNLGYPLLSTLFNWGRATLGTIPFVWFGSHYGPKGVLIGQALGVVPFGTVAVIIAFIVIKHVKMHVVLPQRHSGS